ncbi:hypothetical protein JTM20_37875, partial [Pseudomonas aeruginosa]|nr:hypothetical protein [Pseudomonas aeruginosa]
RWTSHVDINVRLLSAACSEEDIVCQYCTKLGSLYVEYCPSRVCIVGINEEVGFVVERGGFSLSYSHGGSDEINYDEVWCVA